MLSAEISTLTRTAPARSAKRRHASAIGAGCLALALAAASAAPASGATLFTNADAANNFISNAGNWGSGLPVGQQGTINANAQYDSDVTHSGYDILHTGGNISRGNGFATFALGTGTTWVMDGATAAITQARGIDLRDNSSFTLIDGNANLSDNNRDTNIFGAGAALQIDGGTMTIGRNLIVRNGGSFTINGGTISGIDQFLTQSFASAAAGFFFNGGSTTADTFELTTAGTATFGGSTAGSLTLLTGLGNGVTLNWLDGSLMALTVNGADQTFYESLYANGDLLFEGSNAGTFGDQFQVTDATLTLVIPEPGSFVLLGLGGLLMINRRRRA